MVVWFPFSSMGTDGSGLNLMIHCLESGRQKKFIGSFWPLLTEIHPQAASEIEHQVYWPVDGTQFDAEGICAFLLRRLAGLDEPQQWNPFR